MAPPLRPQRNELGARPPDLMVSRWVSQPFWSLRQASYLVFGLDPARQPDIARAVSSDAQFEAKRDEIVQRANAAIEAGTLPGRPSPIEFIRWADSAKIPVSSRWLSAVGLAPHEGKLITVTELDKIKSDALRAELINLWALAPTWTLQEGVSLSLNIRPETATTASDRRRLKAKDEFERRLTFAHRAVSAGQLSSPLSPDEFLDWAEKTGFPFPEDWRVAVPEDEPLAAQYAAFAPLSQTPEIPKEAQNPLAKKERDSLLKLVIGMAIKGYIYDPKAARNSAPTEIANDLALLGIPLDPDTVRKWLNEGAEILPQSYDADD